MVYMDSSKGFYTDIHPYFSFFLFCFDVLHKFNLMDWDEIKMRIR
ncbi:hypothetical protein PMEGAPL103_56810 [Priestia megaterium]